jgi:hypothetical protein
MIPAIVRSSGDSILCSFPVVYLRSLVEALDSGIRILCSLADDAAIKPSELELKASLEELGIAFEVESIQTSNAIGAHKSQVVRQVPIEHRSESPKLAAL